MSVFNARALATLVTVAGNALSKRLTVILNALVKEDENMGSGDGSELKEAIEEALRALLSSINDPEGLNTLMLLLLGWYDKMCPACATFTDSLCPGQDMTLLNDESALAICLPFSAKKPNSTLRYIA
jgi:hypothetical protein